MPSRTFLLSAQLTALKLLNPKMGNKKEIKLTLQRFDSEINPKAYCKSYTIQLNPNITVMALLDEIKRVHDPDLAFRCGCRSGICGICAVKVNGTSFLACKTKIKDVLVNNSLFIEAAASPIKDLVSATASFWLDIERLRPWLMPKGNVYLSMQEQKAIEDSSRCIFCSVCYFDCPTVANDPNFPGPAAIVKSHRLVFDKRDRATKARLKQLQFAWKCTHAWNCVEQCPQNIDITKCMDELKHEISKLNIKSKGLSHARYFVESAVKYGRLNEFMLPIRTLGFRTLQLMPSGLRLWIEGKLPNVLPKRIFKLVEVKRLFQKIR